MSDARTETADEVVVMTAEMLRGLATHWRTRARDGKLAEGAQLGFSELAAKLDAAASIVAARVDATAGAAEPKPSTPDDQRFALAVTAISDEAIFIVSADGRITSWNAGAERITGYAAGDVLGRNVELLYGEEDRRAGKPRRDLVIASREGAQSDETWRVRKNGERFAAHGAITPLRDPSGALVGFASVIRDVTDIRNSLEALRQSEERMRLMVEAVRDYAIFMLDPAGRILSWNTGAQRLKGYEAHDVIGRSFSMFYTEADRLREHPADELRQAVAEGRFEEEGWRVRKDGTQFWANVVITAVFDAHGRHLGFTKVTRDFTERKLAEQKLRQSEERFRLIVDSVRDYAIFMLDPNGVITSWNIGAERIKGYRADEIIGKHFSIFYPEEVRRSGHPQEELRRAVADGSFGEEGWRVRKDGTLLWASVVITAVFDDQRRHVGFAKVTRDLTDRRAADEALRQSEERLRLLVESVKDYAIFMLDTEGRITTWNTGAESIKGYRADEVIGKHFSIFYTPENAAAGLPERELIIARAQGRYEEEGWRVRKNGDRIWANVVLTAIYDERKQLRGFAKVTRDLTARRRIEQEAREAERKAAEERARTLEAQLAVKQRDDFISIAAHELRTPLAALKIKLQGAEDLLRKGEADVARAANVASRLEVAGRHVDRLGQLIERLLDVSRIVGGRFEIRPSETDLAALTAQVCDDFRDAAQQAGCSLAVDAAERVPGNWDRQRLEQVLLNLLSNAIRYGAGKPIEVRVESDEASARLSVTDHGIGVARADQERIFGRFERATSVNNYGGLGLGLYITKHIVDAHGGKLQLTSNPGEGATFVVTLPRMLPEGGARS